MKKTLLLPALLAATALGQAQVFTFGASLSGAAEVPPNTSPGFGTAVVAYDMAAQTLKVDVTFFGLIGTTTAAHIHATTATPLTGTAGVAVSPSTLTGFPAGVPAGSYSYVFDLTQNATYSSGFRTANGGTAAGAEAALFSAMASSSAYVNIHTTSFPGGEIRGFLTPLTPVPEPATTAAIAGGVLGAFALARRFRSSKTA